MDLHQGSKNGGRYTGMMLQREYTFTAHRNVGN